MKKIGVISLFICSLAFGISFVWISGAGKELGTFTVNAIRYLLGFIVSIPFLFRKTNDNKKDLFVGAFLTSITLFVATALQQSSSQYVQTGKIGFISAMYVVFTPLLSFIFFKKKISKQVLFSIILAVVGLFVLCDIKDLSFGFWEMALVVVAISFALEIIIIERYCESVDPIKFMTITFAMCFVEHATSSLIFESISFSNISNSLTSLLPLGIIATGLAYNLQSFGQKYVDATYSSLIMGLDSVISVIAGYFFLNQLLTTKELIGCLIMFIAVIICSIYSNKKHA